MAKFNNPMDHVRVAAPCNADWEQMVGNERARFCGQCNLNVYNLSSMTRSEAESFIAGNEDRFCVRFYRRADGSIITENCPVGLRALRRKLSYVKKAITSAVLTFFAGLGIHSLSNVPPLRSPTTMGVLARDVREFPLPTVPPLAPVPARTDFTMGKVAIVGGRQLAPERRSTARRTNPFTSVGGRLPAQ